MADVFVSYSRKDQQFVRELVGMLAEHGKDAWVDWKDIAPTAEFLAEIRAGIESSDALLFVISPDAAASSVCRKEVEHAERLSKRILPILRRDVHASLLPPAVAQRQWIFFREDGDVGAAAEELVGALDTDFDWVRAHTELLEKALEWDRRGRDGSFLLRGTGLRAAEEWLVQPGAAEKEPPPAPLHSEYVLASSRAAERRQRGVIAGVTAALAVAIVLAVVALVQRSAAISQRQTAVSQLVASEALRRMDTRLDEALLLSVAALRVKETPEARHALLVGVHRSQRVLALLRPRAGPVGGAVFSPDGHVLAVAAGAEITLHEVGARAPRGVLRAGPTVRALSFSRDGRLLAASAGGRLRVWELTEGGSGRRMAAAPAVARVQSLAFSPEADLLAVGTEDGQLVLWEPGTRRTRAFATGAPVAATAFSPDGSILAAGGPFGAFLLDPAAGPPSTLQPVLPDFVTALSFVTRTTLAVVVGDGRLRVWDAEHRRPLCTPQGLPPLMSVASDRRGGAAAGARDGQVLLLGSPCAGVSGRLSGHGDAIATIGVSTDGSRLVSASVDGLVAVWTTGAPSLVRRVATGFELVTDAAFVWRERTVAAGGEGGVVITGPGGSKRRLADAPSSVLAIASAPAARVLAAAGDGRGAVWTGTRYAPVRLPPTGAGERTVSVALDPDGAFLAQGTERGTVTLRRMGASEAPSQILRTGVEAPVIALAFGGRGDMLAAGGNDGRIVVWDLEDGDERRIVRASGPSVSALAFDPAGERLAAGDDDDIVTLWSLDSGMRLARLSGHQGGVTDLAFASAGGTLVSSDGAGQIKIWDAESLRPLGEPLRTEDGSIEALDFDGTGTRLAAAGKAGTVLLLGDVFWDAEQAVARLCGVAGRSLGDEEWGAIVDGDRPPTCER